MLILFILICVFLWLAAEWRESGHKGLPWFVRGAGHRRCRAALPGGLPDALFFAGDLGQRIFQTPFFWKSLGVDIRGRSQTLRINYRTSHQIRMRAAGRAAFGVAV